MRAFLAAAALCLSSLGVAQVDPNRVVAVVNGDEIRGAEYYRRMEYMPANLASGQLGLNNLPAGFLTLKQLVTEKLIFQMARTKGVAPTEPELNAEYTQKLADSPELLAQWKESGRTEEELRYEVKYELTQFKIRTAGITITDQEITDHYKKYPTEFTIPTKYKLALIVVNSEAEQKAVDSELAAGKAFKDVATAHSLDSSRANGGEFGFASENQLSPAYLASIKATGVGKTTDWLNGNGANTGTAKIKFLIMDTTPSSVQPLTPVLKRQLRKRLMLDRGAVKNDVTQELTNATLAAKIDIRQPEFARLYKQMVDAFSQQSKKG